MNRLNLKRSDIYEIEVNDKGDTIQFSIEDISLPFRLQTAYDKANAAMRKLKSTEVIISKRKDTKEKDRLFSKNEEAIAKAREECYMEMREAMDFFIGEGGCQKVFGDQNYISMFDDLMDALNEKQEDGLSHLEHLKLSAEDTKEKIIKKYGNENGDVL